MQAADDEQAEAKVDHGLAAEAVSQGSVDHLGDCQTEKERREDELGIVGAPRTELSADRRQCRQHGIDRHRDQRHHQRDERNELAVARSGAHARSQCLITPSRLRHRIGIADLGGCATIESCRLFLHPGRHEVLELPRRPGHKGARRRRRGAKSWSRSRRSPGSRRRCRWSTSTPTRSSPRATSRRSSAPGWAPRCSSLCAIRRMAASTRTSSSTRTRIATPRS